MLHVVDIDFNPLHTFFVESARLSWQHANHCSLLLQHALYVCIFCFLDVTAFWVLH